MDAVIPITNFLAVLLTHHIFANLLTAILCCTLNTKVESKFGNTRNDLHGRYIFTRESIRCVADQQTCFTYSSVTDK